MKYYLGIDGGGTKTSVVLTDETGNVISKSNGKTINFYSVGMEKARNNLAEAIDEIKSKTGVLKFDGAVIGCSALDKKADEETVRALCSEIIDAEKIMMTGDADIALKAMDDAVCPLVAICGTGSMAIAENEDDEILVAGGWGHILGDEGSAYSVALNALKKCCALCDKGESSPVTEKACEYFGVDDFRGIINIIYSPNCSKDVVAGFAKFVGKLCESKDELCESVIKTEAQKFSQTVTDLLKKVKKCKKIGLYGGVFQNNRLFRDIFTTEIKNEYPDVVTELLTKTPEMCAADIARTL